MGATADVIPLVETSEVVSEEVRAPRSEPVKQPSQEQILEDIGSVESSSNVEIS